jgi:putative hydrolase of the HAD superfamily
MSSTLIIDADDTLWENNIHYEAAIDRFLELLSSRKIPKDRAHDLLMKIEARNVRTHGYGTRSFHHSLRDTLESMAGEPPSPAELETLDELTRGIRDMSIDFLPGVVKTLERLRERFRLILFTKGDLEEQQRKVDRSGVATYFDHVELTPEKNRRAYTRLIQRYRLDPDSTWMVGNSPRSDINPALQAGLHAILIPHPRTWELERAEVQQEGRERFRILERFEDLLEMFKKRWKE